MKQNIFESHTLLFSGLTIDIIMYNANVNMFSAMKLLFEFQLTGGISITQSVRTFNLYAYTGAVGVLLLIVQAIWIIILIFFVVREIRKVKKLKCSYFKVEEC